MISLRTNKKKVQQRGHTEEGKNVPFFYLLALKHLDTATL